MWQSIPCLSPHETVELLGTVVVLVIEVMTGLVLAVDGNVNCDDPVVDPVVVDGIYDVVVAIAGKVVVVETKDDVDKDAVDAGLVDVWENGCCLWVVDCIVCMEADVAAGEVVCVTEVDDLAFVEVSDGAVVVNGFDTENAAVDDPHTPQ